MVDEISRSGSPVDGLSANIGTLLMGDRRFGGDDPYKDTHTEGEAFGIGWIGPRFVLFHSPRETDDPDVTFVCDLVSGVTSAKVDAGERYVNALGANVARQCLDAGTLDEALVFVAPVLLGDGTRLFGHPGGTNVAFESIDHTHPEQSTAIWLRVSG